MPYLLTLRLECAKINEIYVEAPMLYHFHLAHDCPHVFEVKMYKNLKTISLKSLYIDSLLSNFWGKDYLGYLTLDLGNVEKGCMGKTKFTLWKVFSVFPKVSSLCIYSSALLELENSSNSRGEQIPGRWKGLKTFRAYLLLVDPALTFSRVACVMNECICLSEVSLLIHHDVDDNVSMSFMSSSMALWPGLK